MNGNDNRSLPQLIAELARETRTLLQQEITLAKTEAAEHVHRIETGIKALAIGGAVLFCGILVLLASAVLGLSLVMEPWLAALVVGGVITIVGVTLLVKGKGNLSVKRPLPRTRETLREDKQWIQAQIR